MPPQLLVSAVHHPRIPGVPIHTMPKTQKNRDATLTQSVLPPPVHILTNKPKQNEVTVPCHFLIHEALHS